MMKPLASLVSVACTLCIYGCDKAAHTDNIEARLAVTEQRSARVDDLDTRLHVAERGNLRIDDLASRLAAAERRIEQLEAARKPDASWVLWRQNKSAQGFNFQPVPEGAYPTQESCLSSVKGRGAVAGANPAARESLAVNFPDHIETYSCLPPSIDPRFKH